MGTAERSFSAILVTFESPIILGTCQLLPRILMADIVPMNNNHTNGIGVITKLTYFTQMEGISESNSRRNPSMKYQSNQPSFKSLQGSEQRKSSLIMLIN